MLELLLARIDDIHRQDPDRLDTEQGPQAKELMYAKRMTARLETLVSAPSVELQIAVRAQHLARWEIPRTRYPKTKAGYHRWRTEQKRAHAKKVSGLMAAAGFDPKVVGRVGDLIEKRNLKDDPEAQMLEDVACLVFLEYEFDAFADGRDDHQLLAILRKTARKMSPGALAQIPSLALSVRLLDLLSALNDPAQGDAI